MKINYPEYYVPHKLYIHKTFYYSCKFIGYSRKKATYEVVSTNETCCFKVGNKFTPIEPEKWFDITNTFIN